MVITGHEWGRRSRWTSKQERSSSLLLCQARSVGRLLSGLQRRRPRPAVLEYRISPLYNHERVGPGIGIGINISQALSSHGCLLRARYTTLYYTSWYQSFPSPAPAPTPEEALLSPSSSCTTNAAIALVTRPTAAAARESASQLLAPAPEQTWRFTARPELAATATPTTTDEAGGRGRCGVSTPELTGRRGGAWPRSRSEPASGSVAESVGGAIRPALGRLV